MKEWNNEWVNEIGALMLWCRQEKPEDPVEKSVTVLLFPPQVPHGLVWKRIQATEVRDRRLTAWVGDTIVLAYIFAL